MASPARVRTATRMDQTIKNKASYWVPMAVFAVFTAAEGYAPISWYPWLYLAKLCAVVAALALLPQCFRDITPSWKVVLPALAVGLLIFGEWILLDRWIPYPHLGARTAFNPFSEIPGRAALVAVLVGRFFGLVVLVPLIEENFWRNLGLRYATNPDVDAVPIGTYSAAAFWLVAIGSAITHPEWLVALVAGVLFALLLKATHSMFAVILSHAVANLALGIYIVTTGDWKYW